MVQIKYMKVRSVSVVSRMYIKMSQGQGTACYDSKRALIIAVFLVIVVDYESYCSTVHFRRITSIYQPTNAHIISHKTLLRHFNMFRSCQIIIREFCFLLQLCYSIYNSNRICKRGVVAAYHVVWECLVEQ